MSVTIVNGDLFDTDAKYICHQVNCRGKMGSGVAKQVRERYPNVYASYQEMCESFGSALMGKAQFVKSGNKTIINLFAQNEYGYDGQKYTDYLALINGFQMISANIPDDETIAMPYKIGCGLGGGDWDMVFRIINSSFPDHHIMLYRKDVPTHA